MPPEGTVTLETGIRWNHCPCSLSVSKHWSFQSPWYRFLYLAVPALFFQKDDFFFFFLSSFIFNICVCVRECVCACLCTCAHVCKRSQHVCGGQKTSFRGHFSSTTQVLGIELLSLGLAARAMFLVYLSSLFRQGLTM